MCLGSLEGWLCSCPTPPLRATCPWTPQSNTLLLENLVPKTASHSYCFWSLLSVLNWLIPKAKWTDLGRRAPSTEDAPWVSKAMLGQGTESEPCDRRTKRVLMVPTSQPKSVLLSAWGQPPCLTLFPWRIEPRGCAIFQVTDVTRQLEMKPVWCEVRRQEQGCDLGCFWVVSCT
jgi:hypothetical protein